MGFEWMNRERKVDTCRNKQAKLSSSIQMNKCYSYFGIFDFGSFSLDSQRARELSSYESGIKPMGDAWLQFRIPYYMFALVLLFFDVETVFLYPWAMSFDVLGISIFIEAFIFVLILIFMHGEKEHWNVISTTSNELSNWSRLSSLWPLLYGTSCCFIEFASLIGSRFDFDRYGLVPRSSPRQADLILTAVHNNENGSFFSEII
ncbi:nad(p)h-quinone oxidoreductase subunit k [Quercus suber]|uniref:NADH-ubiquinone oxidoreductase chain 3 n=1 Tax=Quercus suber TaxID=58331 RepID=A0AAW0I5R9_QUESU